MIGIIGIKHSILNKDQNVLHRINILQRYFLLNPIYHKGSVWFLKVMSVAVVAMIVVYVLILVEVVFAIVSIHYGFPWYYVNKLFGEHCLGGLPEVIWFNMITSNSWEGPWIV